MNLNTKHILFFDSGIGGLSIYQAFEQLPISSAHNIIYCLDNQAFPYSEKSEEFLIKQVNNICQHINRKFPLEMIVIACNTASTVVLPTLRSSFKFPVVGTVPAIKPAVQISKTHHIALVATKGTVNRVYVDNLINDYGKNCVVEKFGSTLLVEMAEQKLQGQAVDLELLREHLKPLAHMPDLDTVILGCTHFPFLETELKQVLPQVKNFIHGGVGIARRINELFNATEYDSNGKFSTNSKGCRLAKTEVQPNTKHLLATQELKPCQQQIFTSQGFDNYQLL